MVPRPSPKTAAVTSLTKKQVRSLMEEQAKRVFGRSASDVLRGLRSGEIPKTAAAANIAMLGTLLGDNE